MDKETSMHLLKQQISNISLLHNRVSKKWIEYARENDIALFNQKAVKVSHLDETLLESIEKYSEFLNMKSIVNCIEKTDDIEYVIDVRVKNIHSIMDKYNDYCNWSPHKGEVSVNKCFNDIFGIRSIIDCDELTFHDIEVSASSFSNIIIENKSFDEDTDEKYVATHLYFKGDGNSEENNKNFRWELQIWRKRQEKNNQHHHLTHRFKYTYWESLARKNV